MQATRDLVRIRVELTARVQLGQNHLGRGHAFFFVNTHGNAAPVIDDGDRIVDVDGYTNLGAVTGQRFIHRIVHYFVDQVMQPHLAG